MVYTYDTVIMWHYTPKGNWIMTVKLINSLIIVHIIQIVNGTLAPTIPRVYAGLKFTCSTLVYCAEKRYSRFSSFTGSKFHLYIPLYALRIPLGNLEATAITHSTMSTNSQTICCWFRPRITTAARLSKRSTFNP